MWNTGYGWREANIEFASDSEAFHYFTDNGEEDDEERS